MFAHGAERKIAPILVMGSVTLEIVTLCAKNWLEGYYGDVTVVTLCPWRLCLLECLKCEDDKPVFGCFWMQDWNDTGFETFGIVSHLEYWSLAFITLSLLLSVMDYAHSHIRRRTGCSVEFSKPTLLILIVGSLLSTLSVAMFGAKLHHKTNEITKYAETQLHFAWPYFVRVASAVLAWCATVASIFNQCSSTTRTLVASDDSIMVITAEGDFDDDSIDEAENGVLL